MTNYYEETPQGRDPKLWEIAKRRASFKYHLATYVVVISAMWIFWYFVSGEYNSYPWPIWPTMGWGIGLLFHFLGAFVFPHENGVEKEYEKMIRNRR